MTIAISRTPAKGGILSLVIQVVKHIHVFMFISICHHVHIFFLLFIVPRTNHFPLSVKIKDNYKVITAYCTLLLNFNYAPPSLCSFLEGNGSQYHVRKATFSCVLFTPRQFILLWAIINWPRVSPWRTVLISISMVDKIFK